MDPKAPKRLRRCCGNCGYFAKFTYDPGCGLCKMHSYPSHVVDMCDDWFHQADLNIFMEE